MFPPGNYKEVTTLIAVVVLIWLGIIALWVTLSVLCWRKGKHATALIGFFLFHPALIIGAIRLAKPDSEVGLQYSEAKFERSCKRFPKHVAYALNARPIYLPRSA